MSDAFHTSEVFIRTHERRALYYGHPGYTAECYCGYHTRYRRFALFAVWAHVRHQHRAMRGDN